MIKKIAALIILILLCMPIQSVKAWTIPQTTLQIAKDAGLACVPNNKTVRVGIGNQTFSSYVWDKVSIYGTGEFEVYSGKDYINTYDASNVINISISGRTFILSDAEGNEIIKASGPIKFNSYFGFIGINGLKRGGKDAVYRGEIELVFAKDGYFHVVNSLDVEDYLRGVVPNEMPVHFGLEALKAQAVAARNYVLSPRVKANPNYDVVDSVASQVYYGANTEKELSNKAVEETKGIVATYNGEMILALYSSTAGGYTESYENAFSDPKTRKFPAEPKPYLKARPDFEHFCTLDNDDRAYDFYKTKPKSFDENSRYFRWEREWTQEELQQEIQNHIAAQSAAGFVHPEVNKGEVIAKILRLNVLQRGLSGKIMKLEIQTEKENYIVEKELVIRRLLTNKGKALPSANVVFEQEFDDNGNLKSIKAYGGGYGHGVGMSQFGAGYMATNLHLPFDKILQHYYSGVALTTEPFILSQSANQQTQTFYSKDGKGYLIVENKGKLPYLKINVNYTEGKIDFDTTNIINKIDLSSYLQKGVNTITFNYPLEAGHNKNLKIYVEIVGKDEFNR